MATNSREGSALEPDGGEPLTLRSDGLPCVLLVLLAAALLTPLFDSANWFASRGWPPTHDNTFRYFWLVEHFHAALAEGSAYPRWLPEAFGGYGSPIFVFYQPGFFYVASLVHELGGSIVSPLVTMGWTLLVYFGLGGIGAYVLARRYGSALPALLCAATFLVTPYISTNLNVRGDVTEFAGMLLAPWPLWGAVRLIRWDHGTRWALARRVLVLALTLAVMPLTHPAVALFFFPCCAVLALVLCVGSARPRQAASAVALSFVLSLCLSAPYWVTFLYMRKYVMFDDLHQGYFTASHHLVWPKQLLSRFWGFGASLEGPADGMSFQLGLAHAGLAVAGGVAGRRLARIRAAGVLYALMLLMMTPIAAPLWDRLPFLASVQFPWRILSVTACLQLVLVTGLCAWPARRSAPLIAGGLVLACLWSSARFFPNPERVVDAVERIEAHATSYREIFHAYSEPTADAVLARTALDLREAGPRGERPLLELAAGEDRERAWIHAPGHTPYRMHFLVDAGAATRATLNQVYLPGWIVEIDGRRLTREALEASLDRFGRLELALPAEACELRAHYGGPPHDRWVLLGASLVAVLASLAYLTSLRGSDRMTEER